MRRPLTTASVLLAAMALAAAANAGVVVTFKDPGRYSETGIFREDGAPAMKEIEAHLKRLGEAYLPADQVLRIEILDIDLAGEERYNSRGRDVRILQGRADWPSIKLRYTWERPGASPQSGEETVSDMSYLQRTVPSTAAYAYEKRMLEAWFRQRFGTKKAAAK